MGGADRARHTRALTTDRLTPRSLIDEYLPVYDWSERHSLTVLAPASAVHAALRTADLAKSPVVRALLELRALPARWRQSDLGTHDPFSDKRTSELRARAGRATLDSFQKRGFTILDERRGEELLIGLVGRFWTMDGGICETDSERFRAPLDAGTARVAWNFATTALDGGKAALLTTETRIQAADAASRKSFARYWLFIRPFSGLIRRLMLRAIGDEAERAASEGKGQ
jgi:hypothetical protein